MGGVLYEDLLVKDGGGCGYVMTAGRQIEGMPWGGGGGGIQLAPYPM